MMPVPKKSHKGLWVTAAVAIVLLAAVAYAWMWLYPSNPVALQTPTPSVSGTPLPAGVKTYTSQVLGVSFEYLASSPYFTQLKPGDAAVIERGNQIWVGGAQGQSVQEFAKEPADRLDVAIKKKFLAGIADKDCPVLYMDKGGNTVTAAIDVGFEMTDWGDPRFDTSPCPVAYRVANGIRYFWMDRQHPEKFFFFDIGQYGIPAAPEVQGNAPTPMWQDTFRVVNSNVVSVLNTSAWKKYTNAQYGFEVKYPPTVTAGALAANSDLGSVQAPVGGIYVGPLVFVPLTNEHVAGKAYASVFSTQCPINKASPDTMPYYCNIDLEQTAGGTTVKAISVGPEGSTQRAYLSGGTIDFYVDGGSEGYDFGKHGTLTHEEYIAILSSFRFVK